MNPDLPAAVHALLRVTGLDALVCETEPPSWVTVSLLRAPWAVVRRAAPLPALWPVGVRGDLRRQRYAAWLPHGAVQECITPQMLAANRAWRQYSAGTATPAVAVLDNVATLLDASGFAGCWGPAGSVGFELASGVPSTTSASDLDLVLTVDEPLTRIDAARLQDDLSKLPVSIDLLLETPHGAAALAEYARGGSATLLRSAQGPRLVRDPWRPDGSPVGR
jgi:phosphoribosyl-dephospho-CoA transferase